MTLSEAQQQEIQKTIERYRAAYEQRDKKALLALFSPAVSGYGAGADEIFRNRKEYAPLVQRDLDQATAISLEFTGMHMTGDGHTAWVMSGCTCTFAAGGKGSQVMRVRMSLGLKNTGSRWQIEQLHLSVPNAAQAPGQAFSGE